MSTDLVVPDPPPAQVMEEKMSTDLVVPDPPPAQVMEEKMSTDLVVPDPPPAQVKLSSWKPKKRPIPMWNNFHGVLEYQRCWVTMVENEASHDSRAWGCLYLIGDRGLLWTQFGNGQKYDKFIAFENMDSFRMNKRDDRPELGRFLEIVTKGPIITNYEVDKPKGGVVDAEDKTAVVEPDETVEDDALVVSAKFILNAECYLDEMHWYLNKLWNEWKIAGTQMRPTYWELHPPGQFDDADAPRKSAEEYKKELEEYEARVTQYGKPIEPSNHFPRDPNLFKRGSTHSMDYPRNWKIFSVKKNTRRFDEKLARWLGDLDCRNWMGRQPARIHPDEYQLEVASGRYADSHLDQSPGRPEKEPEPAKKNKKRKELKQKRKEKEDDGW